MHGRNVRLSKEYDVCVWVCVHAYLCDCQNVAELCLWMQGDSPGCSGGLLCGLTIIEIGSKTRKNNEGKHEGTQQTKQRSGLSLRTTVSPPLPPFCNNLQQVPLPQCFSRWCVVERWSGHKADYVTICKGLGRGEEFQGVTPPCIWAGEIVQTSAQKAAPKIGLDQSK